MKREHIRKFDPNDTSVTSMMEKTLKANWDRPAFTNYGSGQSYTFSEVAKMIARLHTLFRALGIEPGNKIALCDKNSAEWAVSFLAAFSYGAVVVPILSEFNTEQIQNIYDHSDSRILICGRRYADKLQARILHIENFSMKDEDVAIDLTSYTDMQPQDVSFFREKPEDPALISYTSGSTGRSKGVMLPYQSVWSNAHFVDELLEFDSGENTFALLPLAHMYGFSFDFMAEFLLGCHVHFLTKTPSPHIVTAAFQHIKPIVVVVVPLIIEKIVRNIIFPIMRTPHMRALTSIPMLKQVVYRLVRNKLRQALGGNFYETVIGGAALSKDVEDFLRLIKFPYTVGYGMTECGPLIGYEDWSTFKKGSCGKAAPRMEVKVLSEDPENIPGEIITRGMNLMLGYYKNETETLAAIDEEGWLHTGDLGVIDSEGNIFIRGRKKNMLLGTNGQNIYPEEIEDIIMARTIFEESVVVQRGEKLVALVYVSDPALQHHGLTRKTLNEHLSTYKRQINSMLPHYANISAIEVRENEFEKTPKHNIKRYLYT